jgi:hypothetical protein
VGREEEEIGVGRSTDGPEVEEEKETLIGAYAG